MVETPACNGPFELFLSGEEESKVPLKVPILMAAQRGDFGGGKKTEEKNM